MRICPRCKQEKELSEFPVINKKTGRIIYCSDCKKEYDKEYWAKITIDQKKTKHGHQEDNRQRNKLHIINFLKNSVCKDCGNDDWRVLEFDHRDRTEKKFNLADSSYYSINKIQKEIDKCDVVCANCHRIRTIIQRGYYKYENVV